MQAYLKQTNYILNKILFTFLVFTITCSAVSASNDCNIVIEEVISNGIVPSPGEKEAICSFVDNQVKGGDEACPTPQNLEAIVNRDDVTLNWQRVSQANSYLITAFNSTRRTEITATTDVNTYTFRDLEPGLYIFSVKASCGDGQTSAPAFKSSIIIGDIAIIKPTGEPECNCTEGQVLYAGLTNPPQLLIPWEDETGCSDGEYRISMIINSIHHGKLEVSYDNADPTIFIDECGSKHLDFSFSTNTVSASNGMGTNLLEVEFSETEGILFNPQISFYSYLIQVKFCCQSDIPGNEDPGDIKTRSAFNPNASVFPNPFNQNSIVQFRNDSDSEMNILLYNSVGQVVREVYNGFLAKGPHQQKIDGNNLEPGLYYLRIKSNTEDRMLKMIKL